MKVQINFYDELITINLPKAYSDFKNEIGKKYSIDSVDVEELIIFYSDSSNIRVAITNESDYSRAIEYFEGLNKKKNKLPEIMLEVSEKSMLFMREIENSKLASANLPLQSENKKDQIQIEIEEKERILRELMEKEKKEAEIKKLKDEKEIASRLKEEERLRKNEEKEKAKKLKEEEKLKKEEEKLRKNEEKEKAKRLQEDEKRKKAEEKEKENRLKEEENLKKAEEEKRLKIIEEELLKQKLEEARQKQKLEEEKEIQRRMEEDKQRRNEEEQRIRKERESTLREKLMEMKLKIEKEKAKYQEKCFGDDEVKGEDDIKVENVDKPCDVIPQHNKNAEQEKVKKHKKEDHLKKPKLDSEKKLKKELKKKFKQLKKEKASLLKDQFHDGLNQQGIDPEFSEILSKVINENMESAKDKIIKKALKESSKIFEKTRQSLLFSSNISARNVVHSAITCDGCRMFPLTGIRYKCTVCEDFDYCELCEEKFSEVHRHPFLKIRRPEVAPYKILCAIDESVPDFVQSVAEKINLDSPSEIVKDNKGSKEEVPQEDFFSKVKNAITNNVKEIPKNFMKFEGMIQKGVQNLISSESEERKSLRPRIVIARQCYDLESLADEKILDALVETGGDIDNAICLLFTEKEN